MITTQDIEFIKRACLLCDKSNCTVKTGSILVKDGEVLVEAWNEIDPKKLGLDIPERDRAIHSEQKLFELIKEKGLLIKDSTLYVTRFPCVTCSKLLVSLGVAKIYYMSDLFTHGNEASVFLKSNGIKIEQIKENVVWNRI